MKPSPSIDVAPAGNKPPSSGTLFIHLQHFANFEARQPFDHLLSPGIKLTQNRDPIAENSKAHTMDSSKEDSGQAGEKNITDPIQEKQPNDSKDEKPTEVVPDLPDATERETAEYGLDPLVPKK
ncbi:hypothetical protein FGLOB1_7629 [Fusarium globosum]|uniref:Uncharacterized protein n=1 Tax=Fusarium globosum TaxID=78864 RepID=A0A8H6D6R8_9HYPO|nr:hypothetical protein FGLOB1_7629 [Fusarium globosum]